MKSSIFNIQFNHVILFPRIFILIMREHIKNFSSLGLSWLKKINKYYYNLIFLRHMWFFLLLFWQRSWREVLVWSFGDGKACVLGISSWRFGFYGTAGGVGDSYDPYDPLQQTSKADCNCCSSLCLSPWQVTTFFAEDPGAWCIFGLSEFSFIVFSFWSLFWIWWPWSIVHIEGVFVVIWFMLRVQNSDCKSLTYLSDCRECFAVNLLIKWSEFLPFSFYFTFGINYPV